MQQNSDKKAVVEGVRKEIEASKGSRIWQDYVNALKLISQVVFTRSSGFILELLQNAEDAGLGIEKPGVFEISISQSRVKVVHNARPFSEENVKAICGIRSSKKPEKGTLGYLGIGFKSVFKVTDCPEIYSNGFQFKFDRNHHDWTEPLNTPWHVLPLWIDSPSEAVDNEKTTIVIPIREGVDRTALMQEVEKLRTELYLFLRWIRTIRITDEVLGRTWTLESVGEDTEGISTLKHGTEEYRFKIFRRIVAVAEWVRQDRLTQEYRANVTNREIAIAFALDKFGNLAPSDAGAMYGGVYSFLPLGEAKSGAKFPIQADFLVQPGRDSINYEAKWNRWLVREVASLCREAIDAFKKHPNWKYQFLPAFEFNKSKGFESYEKLFGPELIEAVEKFLENDECVPTEDGGWAKLSGVVRLTEDAKAKKELIEKGILGSDEIAPALGGSPGLKLAHPDVKDRPSQPLRKVDRSNLLGNASFLQEECNYASAVQDVQWFRSLYSWLSGNPIHICNHAYHDYRVSDEDYKNNWRHRDRRSYKYKGQEHYPNESFVLTADHKLLEGRAVYLPEGAPNDPVLKQLSETLQKQKPILHPDILASAKDEHEQKSLRGFLTGLTGVQILDSKAICREVVLPQILTKSSPPGIDELLRYTVICKSILGSEIGQEAELWVLTKDGDIKRARETFFSREFKPEQDWETNKKYVSGLSFINPRYLGDAADDDHPRAWREFFKAGGVKDAPANGVEDFALSYATKEWLESFCNEVKSVEKRNFGYDVVAHTNDGRTIVIEVKGLSKDQEVTLTGNEVDAVRKHKDLFYLCIVTAIPHTPSIHPIKDPARVGQTGYLSFPPDTWKTLCP